VLAALNHLGVVEGATEGGPPVTGCMYPAEIANLELAVDTQEKILWLDISVDDVLGIEIGKCVGHLVDVDGAASFGEVTELCELFVKLALAGKFKHEKNTLFVWK
jgi:hypothetical protein